MDGKLSPCHILNGRVRVKCIDKGKKENTDYICGNKKGKTQRESTTKTNKHTNK